MLKEERRIRKNLENTLIGETPMHQGLYEFELKEHIADWREEMLQDGDDFLFAVAEHSNEVAMALLTASGEEFANEAAKNKLRELWQPETEYQESIREMLTPMAQTLAADSLFVTGVKQMTEAQDKKKRKT